MVTASACMLSWAVSLAEVHVGHLRPRWDHVCAVARLAETIAPAMGNDGRVLVLAAVLHDVGYADDLATSGFHPLDGARHLRNLGQPQVAGLVAHHSGARHEALHRGIDDYESEFPYLGSALDHALTFCDMTTSPWGTRIRLGDRIGEIQSRYGRDHTTARAIVGCADELEHAVSETERRIVDAGIVLTGSLAYPD